MLLLLVFLPLVATVTLIPEINGIDRSGIFNESKRELEERGLYVNIVDTIQIPIEPVMMPVSILLEPSYDDSEMYAEFALREIHKMHPNCSLFENVHKDFFPAIPAMPIYLDEDTSALLTRDAEIQGDVMQRIAKLAGMPQFQIGNMIVKECRIDNHYHTMALDVQVFYREGLGRGWIVERLPLGTFDLDGNFPTYKYPVYRTDTSHIDPVSGRITDVTSERWYSVDQEKKLETNYVWQPTGDSALARKSPDLENKANITNFIYDRRTSNGLLVATLSKTMLLSYPDDGPQSESVTESVTLTGHHFHISCKNNMTITIDQMEHKCNVSENPIQRRPEIRYLDEVQVTGSRPIPDSARTFISFEAALESSTDQQKKDKRQLTRDQFLIILAVVFVTLAASLAIFVYAQNRSSSSKQALTSDMEANLLGENNAVDEPASPPVKNDAPIDGAIEEELEKHLDSLVVKEEEAESAAAAAAADPAAPAAMTTAA